MKKAIALSVVLLLSGLACLHAWAQGIPLTGAGGRFKQNRIAPFVANAVAYDGSTNYLTKASAYTGNADGRTGLFSVFFKRSGTTGFQYFVFNTGAHAVVGFDTTTNKLRIGLYDSAATSSLVFLSTSGITDTSSWHSLVASWDTNFSAGNKIMLVYYDGSAMAGSVTDASAAFDIDYATTGENVAAANTGANKINGCIAELFYAPNQFLDISNSSNLQKFVSASNKPVYLGTDGSVPTGTAPLAYLPNAAASVNINAGTGGDLTTHGSFSDCASSPSD